MTSSTFGFGVTWSVTNGGVDDGDDIVNLSDALPFDPNDITSDIEQPDYFNTKFTWDSVELKYSTFDDDYEPLGRFKVRAKIFGYIKKPLPDGGDTVTAHDIPYELESLTIYSEDPNSGGTWVFPKDYPEQVVDPNHPTQYGGVIMDNNTSREKKKTGELSSCGLEEGPEKNAIVPWIDARGKKQEAISAYNYIDVFDETEFSFIPMNSNDALTLADNETFRFTPLYPDVVDENGKAAPIYPMNTVTTFKPDGRDSVTVKYKAEIKARFSSKPSDLLPGIIIGKEGTPINLDNPVATIKQTCVQDVSDYAKQMEQLFQYCNWSNPGQHEQKDLAPDYPILYPYTNVNGFEGLGPGQTPTTRGDDTNNAPLQRGDIWYDPDTENRTYYNVSDIPESLEVTEGGIGYKDRKNVMCVWLPPKERCYKITDQSNIPFGLMCDIKTDNGQVVSATISDTGSPSGWNDGDIVAVTGGKNNARLKISITDEPGWIENYVEVY